jgi:hypothetical protein
MMTIDEEIKHLVDFLAHPAGFDVGMAGTLSIRPIDEGSPPSNWAVDWQDMADGTIFVCEKEFSSLQAAAEFFVEKRRYLCHGLDFENILLGCSNANVEINNE